MADLFARHPGAGPDPAGLPVAGGEAAAQLLQAGLPGPRNPA